MLKVHFGSLNEEVTGIDNYFMLEGNAEWAKNRLVQDIAHDIDKVNYFDADLFRHEEYGYLRLNELSGGTKALTVLLMKEDVIVSGACLGNNCIDSLHKVALEKDIVLTVPCPLNIDFELFKEGVYCLNDQSVMYSQEDYIRKYVKYKDVA